MAKLPENLGKYRILSVLGQGAMGVVYKGLDPDIERTVAIKMMLPHLEAQGGDKGLHQRFRREARAAARCTHPNIVAVYDLGHEDDHDFIVMEYVEGEELKCFLDRGHVFSRDESVYMAIEVLKALEEAHRHGIVHRDIKPGNIILLEGGGIKVADFGVARMDQSELTMTGYLMGTPVYMSPEGLCGRSVDHRADIYSIAMVLLELLTGEKPLPQQIFTHQIGDLIDRTFQTERGHSVSEDLRQVLHKALAQDADSRYSDALAFRRALEQVREQEESEQTVAENLATAVSGFQPAQVQQTPPAGTFTWTPELLRKLEVEVATYTGPVADFLIRKYSSANQAPTALIDSLARHIKDPGERATFVRKAEHCMGTGTCHDANATVDNASAVGGKDIPIENTLTAEHMNRLVQTLAGHVGPFARQLVTHHARRSYQLSDFYDQLAKSIPDPEERRLFLDEING
jgi:serine/threonine-protein kinase